MAFPPLSWAHQDLPKVIPRITTNRRCTVLRGVPHPAVTGDCDYTENVFDMMEYGWGLEELYNSLALGGGHRDGNRRSTLQPAVG